MKIKLLQNWRGKKAGDIIEWPAEAAMRMIETDIAVEVGAEEPEVKAVFAPPADKMVRSPRKRK